MMSMNGFVDYGLSNVQAEEGNHTVGVHKGIKRSSPCQCGSELKAIECCFPVTSYVSEKIPAGGVTSTRTAPIAAPTFLGSTEPPIEVRRIAEALVDSITITQTIGSDSGLGLLPREQVNPQIAKVLGYALSDNHLGRVRPEHSLLSPLHSVKYHQQQCMYRLYLLEKKSTVRRVQGDGNGVKYIQSIQLEDVPLRSEFEAFASRIGAALDAVAKYVCNRVGKNLKYGSHYALLNHLEKHSEQAKVFSELRDLYLGYKPWSDMVVKELRNVVMHEGMLSSLEPGKSMSEDRPFVPPSRDGHAIDELCVYHWKILIEFVEKALSVVK